MSVLRDGIARLGTSYLVVVRPSVLQMALATAPRAEERETSTDAAPAFDEVFRAQFSYVCRTLRRFGVREGDLDDVAQEVFVAVHARFGAWDAKRPIRPWLVSFAYRFAANYARLARHRLEPGLGDKETASAASSPEDALSNREAQAVVLEALQHVRLERRPVLTMHDIDGFSPSEIAAALEIPVNTVYSRLRLAREDFRAGVRAVQRRRGRP